MVKKKRVRFKKYVFKLSFKQKELIDKFCAIHNTTPNKLIRLSIKEFLSRNVSPDDEYYISENQLSIFDEIEENEEGYDEQISIFNEIEDVKVEADEDTEDENGVTSPDSPRSLFD